MFNILGLKVLDEQMTASTRGQMHTDIGHLSDGLYILHLNELKSNLSPYSFKILKR